MVKETFFNSKSEHRVYAVLRVLADEDAPLGSWILKEKLEHFGIQISIASIGRFLKELDAKEYTVLIGNQGRKISEKGFSFLREMEDDLFRFQLEKDFFDASKPKSFQDFLDLLHARKVIEVETAKLAALHADREIISRLEESLKDHCDHASANADLTEISCHFHELVAEASGNRFFYSTLKLLILEEIELEKKYPYFSSLTQGRHYIQDHQEIVFAIKNGDSQSAMLHMESHMNRLIKAIEQAIKGGDL
ncbi:FCD domain-containing protein [Bacillus lacus]|uniref:FCD domain-containing protein n=1 Tax=Metabacillus lacus TaxID=1983721 RepID=A0A7X2J0F1_9BACI|nr:FCD domain-containing protein [Metabacillus lacus]MRX72822.1 FCD domain-containing protein [Metabacillus lacus]